MKFADNSRNQIFRGIIRFYLEFVYCVYSFGSPRQCDSNEYTQHTIIVWQIENNFLNYRHLLSDPAGVVINPKWLEQLISRINFYGPEAVRAIEVRL